VVVWRGFYLAGHGIVEAARRKGIKTLEAKDMSHLSAEQATALMAADVLLPELATIDNDLLNKVLADFGDPLDIPGVDVDLLKEIEFGDYGAPGAPADTPPMVDKAEELRVKWGTETGQLWRLGEHRLICGNCTDRRVVDRVVGGDEMNCLCWDPPFNIGFNYGKELDEQDSKTPSEYKAWLNECLDILDIYLSKVYTCFVWQGMKNVRFFSDWFDRYDWRLISVAKGFVQARPTWLNWATDPVISWSNDTSPKPISCRDFFYNGQSANTKQTQDRVLSGLHPCPRSLEVVEYFINGWTSKGDTVIDMTSGSGTTLIACENLNRQCRAIEISPAYVAVTLQRYADHTGQTPRLIED